MKFFPELKTKRFTVQMRELTIGESIMIASMPSHLEEACITSFLRKVCERIDGIDDPARWTVSERLFAVTHYLAATSEDGPDFLIGKEGHYTEYLDIKKDDYRESLDIGEIGGDKWRVVHMTGGMAEAIERLVGEMNIPIRLHWILGGMAAQLVMDVETIPEINEDYDQWLQKRMTVFIAYPESDFEKLMTAYLTALHDMRMYFSIEFNDSGIIVLPKEAEGVLPPARFPAKTCLTRTAIILAGRDD